MNNDLKIIALETLKILTKNLGVNYQSMRLKENQK